MLTPDLLGGMGGNGFQPANTVGRGGMVWEGRLLCFAPVSYICGALHAIPAVPGVEINSVSWCFKSRTKRAAGTVERCYSAWPSICFYYKSCCFNSFSENPMPLESGDCKKISNLLSKLTLKGNKEKIKCLCYRQKSWEMVHKDHKHSCSSEFHTCLALTHSSSSQTLHILEPDPRLVTGFSKGRWVRHGATEWEIGKMLKNTMILQS